MSVNTNPLVDRLPSLEELSKRYNFENVPEDCWTFLHLLRSFCEQCTTPPRVIDIGCGAGISRRGNQSQWEIKSLTSEYWGLEPDPNVEPEEGLFDYFQHALMETADLPENYFHLAYSYAVMEHVADPASFLQAVYRCLRPGGVYLFMTPNARHYFGIISRVVKRIGLDRLVLRIVTGQKQLHGCYPLEYRFNTRAAIERTAESNGFCSPTIAFLESVGPIGYMRGPLRPMFHLLAWKRRVWRNPESLSTIMCQLRRPVED